MQAESPRIKKIFIYTKKGNSGIGCIVHFPHRGSGPTLDKDKDCHIEQLSAAGGKATTDPQSTGKVSLPALLPPTTQNQDLRRNTETFSERKVPLSLLPALTTAGVAKPKLVLFIHCLGFIPSLIAVGEAWPWFAILCVAIVGQLCTRG